MEIHKRNVYQAGSCSFCDSGKLSTGGDSLIYPYGRVYEVSGSYSKVRFCPSCMEKAKEYKIVSDSNDVVEKLTRE